jgi:hypothetical protein
MSGLFTLSTKALSRLPTHDYQITHFSFIVDGTSYDTTNLIADFLSMRVAHLHSSHPKLHVFEVELSDPRQCFRAFLDLAAGGLIQITDANHRQFLAFASILENPELYLFLLTHYPEDLTLDNSLERLAKLDAMELPLAEPAAFVAAHLFEYGPDALSRLPFSSLRAILESDALNRDKQEDIFSIIESSSKSNPQNYELFEYIEFDRLSVATIGRFLNLSTSLKSSIEFSSGVWRALSRRLLIEGPPGPSDGTRSVLGQPRVVDYHPSTPLNGIIAYLATKCDGNVQQMGIVKVTSSSHYSCREPTNVVALTDESYFYSNNEPNQWLAYEFITIAVLPKGYSIRTRQFGGGCHLQSWVLEASRNGADWTEVDRRVDAKDLDETGVCRYFAVGHPIPARFVRLRQIGPNSNGNHHMTLSRFELFGEIRE